jgi:hypothetical protein
MKGGMIATYGFLAGFLSFTSSAETLLVQPLTMGNIVIAANDTPQQITLDEFGTFQFSSGFRIISRGQIGIYRLTDLPPSSTINIIVNVVNTQMTSDTPSMESFDFEIIRQKETVLSDADGEAELRFGGRITTSGSGSVVFTDTDFTSRIRIIINI